MQRRRNIFWNGFYNKIKVGTMETGENQVKTNDLKIDNFPNFSTQRVENVLSFFFYTYALISTETW